MTGKLVVEGVSVGFGGVYALSDVSLKIPPGEIRGIIGPNGAGKTTLLNVVTGFFKPARGRVFLDGNDVTRLKASTIARRGVARTFQTSKLFAGMTVLENVMAGLHGRTRSGLFSAAFATPAMRREEAESEQRARQALAFAGAADLADRDAEALSFGQQRLVEISRALVSEPTLLLLDEPAVGLNEVRIGELDRLLRRIRDERGITIVMIEHVLRLVMGICDHVTVLGSGSVIAEGTAAEVTSNPNVIESYLGRMRHAQGRAA